MMRKILTRCMYFTVLDSFIMYKITYINHLCTRGDQQSAKAFKF